jgi:hypothetical protein
MLVLRLALWAYEVDLLGERVVESAAHVSVDVAASADSSDTRIECV